MAINDNQKLDFLWKKLGYGVTKTDINSIKNATNESIPSSLLIRGDKLWAEAGDIPATIPTSNTSQVELTSTETTSDLTASENRTWKTSAADWIPPEFGSTYQVKVYIDSAGAANPQSTGTQLFAAGSGNNDEWFFDYQSGVLNFIGDNLPSGISGNKIYVVGARYIGNFGISGTSDGIIEGSNNLYYTDERVDDRVADLIVDGVGITKNYDDAGNLLDISINFTEFDSDDIVEGAVNTFLASRSTDAIPEGSTNLYYTDARTDARISLQSGSNLDLSNKTTTDLAEGTNLYFTDERVDDRVANLIQAGANISLVYDDIAGTLTISATEDNLANNTTDDLVEGSTNLYYTDARVQTYLTNNSYATIGTVTQQVAAQVGAIVSDLDDEIYDREQADLNLQSQIDNLVLNDLTDVSVTSPTSGDALVWNGSSWIPQAPFSQADFDSAFAAKTTTDLAEGTNLYYTEARVDANFATKTTTDLTEGTNLYYTQARFDSAFTAKSTTDLSEGTNLYYTEARVDANFATKTTTDLTEGTNLYYTDERVDDRVAALIQDGVGITKTYDDAGNLLNIAIDFTEFDSDDIIEGAVNTFLASRTTDDIPEGSTNLYYTEARFDARLATKSTTDLAEGTNLYFTEERVDDRVAALIQAGEDISVVYDDVNNTLTIALASSIDGIDLSNNTTDDLSEGSTNLYYTDARAQNVVANSSIGDLNDVNLSTAPITGQTIIWDGQRFIPGDSFSQSDFDTAFGLKDTDDLTEGSTNLYYTDARANNAFDTRLATKSTTDLAEGTNLYYTEARVDANFATKTTTDLAEGTNLYYTDGRVQAYLTANNYATISTVTQQVAAQIGSLQSDLDDEVYDREQGDLALQNQIDSLTTTDVAEGTNLYYTDARFDTRLAAKTTTDLTEGTNLYYTDARVQTKLGDVSGHIIPDTDVTYDLGSTTNKFRDLYLSGSSIYLGSLQLSDNNGALEVTASGSTEVFATETYVDTAISNLIDTAPTTLDTLNELAAALGDDPNFSTTITNLIGTKLATADFNTTADTWLGTKSTTDLSEGTNLYYTDARVDARISLQTGTNLSLANKTTDDLSEGFTNLYYTEARVDANFATKSTTDLAEGTNLYYTDARFDTRLATKSTTDIVEGTNLYYTDARADARIAASNPYSSSDFDTDFSGKTTTDLSEGTNLYYTDARVGAYLVANNYATTSYVTNLVNTQIAIVNSNLDDEIYNREQADIDLQNQINTKTSYATSDFDTDFATKSTTDLAEGTNLYYTDARADARITTFGAVTQSDIDASIAALIDSAPTTLDTLNELAAALGDDPNFATTITNSIATKLAIADFNTTADTWLGTKSTTDLAEGTNLYYTDARVDSRINLQTGTNLSLANKTTDDLTEGSTNLYYTDARFDTRLATKSTTDVAEGTNLYYTNARVDTRFATKTTDNLTEGSTNLYYTDARVDARITAANLFDGQFSSLTNTPTTLAGYGITDGVSTSQVTSIVTQQVAAQTGTIQSDLDDEIYDREQADIGLQNQIDSLTTSDVAEGTNLYYTDARVQSYLTTQGIATETLTSIGIAGNVLTYTDENGNTTNIDLSLYLDDTNLARLVSGSLNGTTGIATFTRDDATTFTIDFSPLFDDTNLSRINSATFTNGTLTLTRDDASTAATISLDGRYLQDLSASTTDDLAEGLTNLYYTQARFDTAFGAKTTTDLIEGVNLYYTDARVRTHVESQDLDLGTNKVLFSNMYANLVDLPSATSYHGMFAHVHATGKAYYAHSGSWIELANVSEIPTTYTDSDVDTHLNTSTATTGQTLIWNGTDYSWGTPPAGYADSDVDTHLNTSTATSNQVLSWDGTDYDWIAQSSVTTSVNPPSSPSNGDLWFDTDELKTYVYYNDGTSSQWVQSNPTGAIGGGGTSIEISDVAPTSPSAGDLWFDSDALKTFIYYDDGSGAQWIESSGGSSISDTDALFEGSTNLYYTDARVDTHLNVSSATNGQTLIWNGTDYSWGTPAPGYTSSDFDTDFATKSTTDVVEGTNLYYTDARVQTKLGDVSGHIIPDTDVTYDLGSSTHKFRDLYLSGNSIILGGITLTESSGSLLVTPTVGGANNTFATESYVDTAISNLVDTAPTTLDTLNELAAALGDDPNFATTITNLIGTKLATADFNTTADSWLTTKSTTNLSEGTNLYYTDARADARVNLQTGTNLDLSSKTTTDLAEGINLYYTQARFDSAFTAKSTTDLSEGTNLYYTDARVRTHVEGQDLDLGTNKVLFSNMYATTGDLPSATSYHGMFAHVHGTGKAYYAHAGSWIELADNSQIVAQDFSWSSITGTPTTLAGYGITDGYVDADVDTHLNTSTATSNQVLSWDGTDYAWVAQSGGGGGGASVSVSDTAPTSPSEGDLWFNSSNTKMYVYFNDGTSSQWIQSNPSGATSPITASDTAPTNPVENSMWFDSTDGTLYFRYNDGTSEQWVNLIGATSSGGGSGGSSVTISDTAPTSPTEGDMWFDSRYAVLLVYYGTQWVNVSGESGSSTTPSWQETTNHTASAGDKLFIDCSGDVVTVTLPASPSMGDEIRIIDATGNASTNNITVARNGNNIQGVADNLTIDTDRAAFGLVYYNSTQGWLLMER